MAERIDGVLSELLAAQASKEDAAPASEIVPNTESAPAEGGDNADKGENNPEAATNGALPESVGEAPMSAEEDAPEGGEVPPREAIDPRIEAIAKATESIDGLRSENRQLRQMLTQMQGAIQQMQKAQAEANQKNEETIASTVLEAPPSFDFEQAQFLDDEERKTVLSQYGTAMAEYAKKSVMKEIQPIVEQYQRQTKEAEDAAVKNKIAASGKLAGFVEDGEQIEKIIRSTPELSSMPPEKKYILGYVINRGVKAMNAPSEAPETVEQLVARVIANPEAMKAIEKERAAKIAAANKSAPPIAASQGQNNAPAVAPNPPQTMEEARERAKRMFWKR